VYDDDGVSNVAVVAYRDGEPVGRTVTAEDGSYEIRLDGGPAWMEFTREGYSSVTRAVAPGSTVDVRLRRKDGSVSMVFGGDVMFGRRYYRQNTDPLQSHYQLHGSDRRDSHGRLLGSVEPIFRGADVTSVNLETPLTTAPWRHPSKAYVFTSHPVAAASMADAGVDYAALANTHAFDALTPGLEETIDALDTAGIAHSGAGFDPAAAAEPAFLDRGNLTIGFVSATTTAGQQYERDWAAEQSEETYTVQQEGETLTVPDDAGVLRGTDESVRDSVRVATERADVVVTQIHGGEEYQRTPTAEIRALTDAAIDAGSDLVVNHHPHVSGGFETRGGALVAWSLGNLFFDQNLWTTYRSLLLRVDVTADGVRNARIEPILLEGYVPRGVTGSLRDRLLWELAGYSDDSFRLTDGTVRWQPTAEPPSKQPLTLRGGIQRRVRGWIASSDGTTQLGRERFVTGEFDDLDVDGDRYEGTLWRYGRESRASDQPIGPDGSGGVELVRVQANNNRAILSPRNRLPVTNDEFTLSGTYRTNADGELVLLVSWYDDTAGSSFRRRERALPSTDREWAEFSYELQRPPGATHVNVFVFLSPPDGIEVLRAAFDRLSLIEWEPPETSGGREYDVVRGPSGTTVRAVPVDGTVTWR
jgi:poly-gamma-glutamate capsule biosynthesis protein CapA/YwtB (metallophosphatase superfamily)